MPRKFVILSHGRAGTNFLAGNLNAHPSVKVFMEPFHVEASKRAAVYGKVWTDQESSYDFVYRNIFEREDLQDSARGFKLFYFHCRENKISSDIWRKLSADNSVAVISLVRRNLLNRVLSDMRAAASGIWHPTTSDYLNKQYNEVVEVHVNVKKLLNGMQYLYSAGEFVRKDFVAHDCVNWDFEDVCEDSQSFYDEVLDLIEVPRTALSTPFRPGTLTRQTTRITNAAEVKSAIGSSIFREYLSGCDLLAD